MTGFIPIKRGSNTPYTASVNRYYVPSTDATALFIGDPVSLAGSADPLGNYPTVVKSTLAANNQWCGIVVGVLPITSELVSSPALLVPYRVASTNAYVLVADDPDQMFMIGEDALGAALAAVDVGNLGISIQTAAGSTVYGRSGIQLDSSTFPAGTATGQIKLLGKVDRPDLSLGTGTTSTAFWRVKINEAMHELATPATTEP